MPAGRGLPKSAFQGCAGRCRDIKARDFLFNYDYPKDLLEPAIGGRHKLYVTYRCMAAMYFSIVLLVTILSDIQTPPFMPYIYFTNWAAVALAITTILQAVCSTRHYSYDDDKHLETKDSKDENETLNEETPEEPEAKHELKLLHRVMWAFHTASLTGNIYVMKYWLFKAIIDPHGSALSYPVITKHGVNVVYILIDFFITGIPVKFLHFWVPMVMGTLYCAFAVIYWACGGRNFDGVPGTYPILNFSDNPLRASLTILLSNVIILVLHCMWMVIFKVRCCLYSLPFCYKRKAMALQVSVIGTKDRRKYNHYDVVEVVVDSKPALQI